MPVKAKDWSKKINAALGFIAAGESVRKSCKKAKIAVMTFLDNVDNVQYAHAREAQADVHFDGMSELEQQCIDGEIDPQVYRVAMDTRKWRLARMRPAIYGDRSQLDHTSSDGSLGLGFDPSRPLKVEFITAPPTAGRTEASTDEAEDRPERRPGD